MSDRPPRSNDNAPDEQPDNGTETHAAPQVDPANPAPSASSGGSGWQTPSSGWRQPGAETWQRPQSSTVSSAEVPALPKEMEDQPNFTGGWHRPRPEDTPFSDSDQLVVTAEPEESTTSAATTDDATTDDATTDDATSDTPDSQQEAQAETTSAPQTSQAPEDMMAMLDAIEDENDEDLFSMSELIALASLVDEEPRTGIQPSDAVPSVTTVMPAEDADDSEEDTGEFEIDALTPAERAVLQQSTSAGTAAPENDPGAYARQQLEALESTMPAEATRDQPAFDAPAGAAGGTDASSAASEYARQQLAALDNTIPPGMDQGATVPPPGATGPAPTATGMDPREEELARRFTETEEEVRTLRQMLHAGQITQEQFEEQLRSLMILDDDQVWWMIGAESDNWYKYQDNDWIAATPPRLPASDYYVNAPLPTLDSQPIPPAATGPTIFDQVDDIELDEYNMPVPRSGVPMIDPDRTVVGPSYLDPYLRDQEQTVASYNETSQPTIASAPVTDVTVASPAVPAGYGAIESPIVTAQPPALTDIEPYAPTYEEAEEAYRSNQIRNLVFAGLAALGIAFLIGVGVVLLILSWYNGIVEEYEPGIVALADYQPQFQTVTLLDYLDRPLATLSQAGQERIEVNLDQMSPYLIHAVVSTQNSTFFNDPGWDFGSVAGTFLDNLTNNPVDNTEQTITQRVAQALIVGGDSSASPETRLHSYVVAGEVTRRYNKNDILQLYLNESFFGNQNYGVEAASQFYFGISAEQLNLAQAAMLASILEDPVMYDPVTNREVALAHINDVLLRMGQVGCLDFQHGEWSAPSAQFCVTPTEVNSSQTILDTARIKARSYRPRQDDLEYPHFVTLVRQQLETAFGPNQLYSSGYTVRTTIVPELQDYVQDRLADQLVALSSNGVSQGAVLITEPVSGAIRVYIGSEDFYNSTNLGETDYARTYQYPGAAIQPIIYAAALDGLDRNGDGMLTNDEYLTPASILWDVPTTYDLNPQFSPTNFNNQFYGPVPVRLALAGQYNVSAVKALDFVGVDHFINTSRDMGLRWEENAAFGLPTALGEQGVRLYDMMVAYGTIATGGSRVPLHAVESIRDRAGNILELPETLRPPVQEQVLPSEIAFLLQHIMSDDSARVASGIPQNSPLNIGNLGRQGWVAAQTGTSAGNRDLWTVGFVSNTVVGVWLGRPDNGPISNQTGLTAAAPLWNNIMTQTVNSNTRSRPTSFPQPNTVSPVPICPDTGVEAGGTCASPIRNEYFAINRRPPPNTDGMVGQVEVNSWTGLLITEACDQPEDRIPVTYVNISDPSALAWLNTGAGRAYAQRIGLPQNIVPRPTLGCDVNTLLPTAVISSPVPNQPYQGQIDINGQVSAPPNFNRYTLEFAPVNTQNWQPITTSNVQQPMPNSVLGNWDTTAVPDGQYALRLGVFSNEGGFVFRTVTINVDNPDPTATPTPTVTPPPTPTELIFPTVPIGPTIPVGPTLDTGFATLPPLPFDDSAQPTATVDTSGS